MDIFNRPPSISEDTLQYILHPPPNLADKASVTTLAVVMKDYTDTLLPDMQWHRDAFQLKVVPNPDGEGFILEGTMRVGDCVDDEWCAVWLLREISARWDVVIGVYDSDGEFLLIEAADHLPSWVSPSNAENRVWIYGSHLHLIPLSHVSPPSSKQRHREYHRAKDSDDEGDGIGQQENDEFLTEQDAVRLVRDPLTETRAPPEVEDAVWRRISRYPDAARMHVHHAKVYLPVDIAKALAVNPALVQKPVESFYTRDALQLRAAHRMARFPPEPSVLTTVRLTRTAYAQLVGQKFYPPKVFGRWQAAENTPEWRWKDVGMKIACGFEMLYQETKNRHTASDSLEGGLSAESRYEALERNPDFRKFIENLTASGYFKEELRGSQLWKTLYEKAATAFIEARREDDTNRPSFASQVDAAVLKAGSMTDFPAQPEDSEEWLNVKAEDFDDMLNQKFGKSTQDTNKSSAMSVDGTADKDIAEHEEHLAKVQTSRLQDLAKQVEDFVEGEGDLSGAVFPDEVLSDDELSEDEESSGDDEDVAMSNSIDSEQHREARRQAMDKLVPGIEPADYGKMPVAYYSNSQRVTRTTVETEVREEIPQSAPDSDKKPIQRPIRPPLLPRDEYEGVDSDDETDEDDGEDDEEDEEDKPQLVGDIEIDMEEEQDEFLEFARQALGVSDEQWTAIVNERKGRGAFVPAHVLSETKPQTRAADDTSSQMKGQTAKEPTVGGSPNTKLDSFEAVMQAMDAEFARARSQKQGAPSPEAKSDKGKGKAKASSEEIGEDDDIEAAMEAELKAALERGDEDDAEAALGEENIDYNLIKNFLESFKSQAGLSGPVGNLAGRMQGGWTLPRDET